MKNSKYVTYLWDDSVANSLDPVERLVYRSNLLGGDQRITNTGGGNTSSKIMETDPLTGESTEVLWVKGSGGDLRTAQRANFASLYKDKLNALKSLYDAADVKGVKTPIEDQMVAYYPHTVFDLNPRAPSIDTPLHGFVPYKHVDHTHPDAVIAIAASRNGEVITREVYGDSVAWVDWQRPGFDLGLVLESVCRENPNLQGIILGQHGLINWSDDDKACYELSLKFIDMAAAYIAKHDKGASTFGGAQASSLPEPEKQGMLDSILPRLRGLVSQEKKFIATVQSDDKVTTFVNSRDAARLAELGTSCPDHFLRTKIKPLYVDWNPETVDQDALVEKLSAGILQYRSDYAAYYEQCKHEDSPAMRDPNPKVILIPGIGMIAWGKNKSESRITAEFYNNAIEVMRGAEAISEYRALPRQEAFDIEYWSLEEAKLRRMPADKSLASEVVVVVGAGSGIGKSVAHRVAKEGAHVVCADLIAESAQQTADELTEIYGHGIGVAGTGISACGPAIGLEVDITKRETVEAMFQQVLWAYGGIDHVVVTAAVALTPGPDGQFTDAQWHKTFDINVHGSHTVAEVAQSIWQAQGLPGSLVLTSSANAIVSKAGSIAYDTSKAAVNHMVRELALTLAPLVRVNGLAPATVVDASGMFPRERVLFSLNKYGIDYEGEESTEDLRNKLSEFYAQRTLTKRRITPEDQAEAVYLLVSPLLSRTTGHIIPVDGGISDAFLR